MYGGMSLKGKCSCLLNIQSALFRFSEQEKAIREKERVRKAKWRASKVKKDPQYIEKVRRYDRERKRNHTSRRYSTSHKDCTSREDRTSNEGSTSCNGNTSRKNSKPDLPCTPVKSSPPSYYKVLSTSKQVQHLLGPSPNTHTTILKHVLNKAIKSPRKNK